MKTDPIREQLGAARDQGRILAAAHDNALLWLDPALFDSWVIESIAELVEGKHWAEINDRFYKTLAFGTGGLRGRTIGAIVTRGERGKRGLDECPERPSVGSNCMNDFNIRRATMGLVAYVRKTGAVGSRPHLVFAHDTRHFSRHFAELAANTVIECDGEASLFESERSTPELSFALRQLNADAGAVITASHNPAHDNGFKAYFNDGAQVVEPHASGIIEEVRNISFRSVCARMVAPPRRFNILGREIDQAYAERVRALVIEPELVRKMNPRLRVVYSPLHGTGAKMVPRLLEEMGCEVLTVPEQLQPDGRFPTVRSPNPENAEALTLSLQLAGREQADLVLATDPDADRMGVAVANRDGGMELISGNQIGSLLAWYRLDRLFARGILNETNRQNARLIKTVVTTDLQKAIAAKFGVPLVETLTGFKYIGGKLRKYEEGLREAAGMDSSAYRKLSELDKRERLLRDSRCYVFGGEESYGYSASDFTRDKDANAACVMFAELAAFVKTRQQTLLDYLDTICSELGCYQEKLGQLVYEGARGEQQIRSIIGSYTADPPREIGGRSVVKVQDYAREDIRDLEGDLLPKERLFFIELDNGTRYAVRGSGTEPKIKFYLFGHEKPPANGSFSKDALAAAKKRTAQFLDTLWRAIETDARARAGETAR